MLQNAGAIPDEKFLLKNKDKVRAFLVTHAHLDHVGAIHNYVHKFPNAQVFGTPFTIEVLKSLMQDSKQHLRNKIGIIAPGGSVNIKGKNTTYKAEFLNMTHSTIQSTMIALNTPEGIVVYTNDYKLDNTPIMGAPPNYEKFKKLAKQGVKVAIVDCLYADTDRKTNSEKIARAMVEETMLTIDHGNNGIIVSTFSSHIARLKSIVEFSKKLNREVIFMGRSLAKYTNAAKKVGQCPFEKDIRISTYTSQLKSSFKRVEKNRGKYVVVCTGHQGEEGSILDRLITNKLHFNFTPKDSVIFSSKIIPAPVNIQHRATMDKKLKQKGVRIFDDVHVSGHGGKEDLRELLTLLRPQHVIPSHGGHNKTIAGLNLAKEMGYKQDKTVHLCQNGTVVDLR
jgi:ribonuclease J